MTASADVTATGSVRLQAEAQTENSVWASACNLTMVDPIMNAGVDRTNAAKVMNHNWPKQGK